MSDLVRHPQGIVFQRIATVGEDRICTSIIVACELPFGAAKSGSYRLLNQVESILKVLPVLPVATCRSPLCRAEIRKQLEQAGTPIGPNDLIIAAHALAMDLTLVTANIREFDRVPALSVNNWLL